MIRKFFSFFKKTNRDDYTAYGFFLVWVIFALLFLIDYLINNNR